MTQAMSAPISPNSCRTWPTVVVRERQRVRGEFGRHAGRGRHAERQHAGAGLHQQRIRMAVIAALELHDLLPAGEAARETDRAHRRLGARTAHAHELDRRHQLDDLAGDDRLDFGGCAERQAVDRRFLHGADHVRMRVTEDHRAPRADVVDELAAIGRPGPRALGAREEDGFAADAAEGAHGRIHAAGDVLAGFLEQAHFAGLPRMDGRPSMTGRRVRRILAARSRRSAAGLRLLRKTRTRRSHRRDAGTIRRGDSS